MKFVIIGASGHGKEVAEVVRALCGSGTPLGELEGFLDDRGDLQGERVGGIPVLGGVDIVQSLPLPMALALGVGYPETKLCILRKINIERFWWPAILHPATFVGRTVQVERGALVQAGVVITANVRIGEFVTVNVGTTINHDCTLERLSTLSPGVNVGGDVQIEEGAFLGIGASVVQGVRIGAWSVIGAGAVVLEDVPRNTLVAGVPARVIRTREEGWQEQEVGVHGKPPPHISLSPPQPAGGRAGTATYARKQAVSSRASY